VSPGKAVSLYALSVFCHTSTLDVKILKLFVEIVRSSLTVY
jgi:hypothetical protein